MEATDIVREIESLPPEAQREVMDFVAFLKARYPNTQPIRKAGRTKLADEPFIGMWRDREDMQDSTAWVRSLRHKRTLRIVIVPPIAEGYGFVEGIDTAVERDEQDRA